MVSETTILSTNASQKKSTIRARNPIHQRLLQAAVDGDVETLRSTLTSGVSGVGPQQQKVASGDVAACSGVQLLRQAVCTSGCSILHWAAGANQLDIVKFLVTPITSTIEQQEQQQPLTIFDAVDVRAIKKSLNRTPFHYCCRNGCIDTAKWLVKYGHANVRAKAKHGVTPFQMAVWQNQLDVCQWLVQDCGIHPADEINDFNCSPVHWIGICPVDRANCNRRKRKNTTSNNDNDDQEEDDESSSDWYDDGRDLLPLATWLADQPGIDFHCRQRQGHTSLHKAAWGGHIALIKYLHTQHDMWDDVIDDAGNYSASLSDMANTPRHASISKYLREECCRDRSKSLKILGLSTTTSNKDQIRKAYLEKARQYHPDRRRTDRTTTTTNEPPSDDMEDYTFDQIREAYVHLVEHNGHGNQSNPAHSLNLMLKATNGVSTDDDENTDNIQGSVFKARLIAVLLEYGDKGIDLSNVRKKWKQVWPNEPFPTVEKAVVTTTDDTSNNNCNSSSSSLSKVKATTSLSAFLLQAAGDVIRLEKSETGGRIRVFSQNCSRGKVNEMAATAASGQ